MTYGYPLLGSLSLACACLPVPLDPVITDGTAPVSGTVEPGSGSGLTGPGLTEPDLTGTTGLTESGPTETGLPEPDSDSETGECETACIPAPEASVCVRAIAWADLPIGLTNREIADGCDECETKQALLLHIDPITGEQTLLAEGPINSWGSAFAVAEDGSIFIAGETKSDGGYTRHGIVLKFSADGTLLWQIKPDMLPFQDLVLRDDEVVVLDGDHELSAFSVDDGDLLWQIPRSVGFAKHVETDAEGAFYVIGDDTFGTNGAPPSWYLRKYAPDRTLLWERLTETGAGDRPQVDDFAVDEAGRAIVVMRLDNNAPMPAEVSIHQFAADGAPGWETPFPVLVPGVDTPDYVHRVVAWPGGGAIALGSIGTPDGAFAVAVDAAGEVSWSNIHHVEGFTGGFHSDAAIVDGALRVVGCGHAPNGAQSWFLTLMP